MSAPNTPKNTWKFVLEPDAWLDEEKQAGRGRMGEHLAGMPDAEREAERKTLQSQAWLSENTGIPFRTVMRDWDDIRPGYADRLGFDGGQTDDAVFHAKMTERVKKDRAKQVYRRGEDGDTEAARQSQELSLMGMAYTAGSEAAGAAEMDFIKFQEWQELNRSKNPDYDVKEADQDFAAWNEVFHMGRTDAEAATPVADKAYDILRKSDNGFRSAKDAAKLFRGLTDTQIILAMRGINERGKKFGNPADASGDGTQMAIAFGRSLRGIGENIARGQERNDLIQEVGALTDPITKARFRNDPDRSKPNWEEIKAQRLADLALEARLADLAQQSINPLRRETTWDKIRVDGSGAAAIMVPLAIPYVGFGAATLAYTEDANTKYVAAGIPEEKAAILATLAGPANALLDKTAFLAVLGKFPLMTGWLKKLAAPTVADAVAVRMAQTAVVELGTETLQNHFTEPAMQQIGAWFDKEIKGPKWAEVRQEAWTQTPDTFLAMAPLLLIGTASATYRDFKNFRQIAQDPALLALAQFRPEHEMQILMAENDKEAAAMVRQFWPDRQPTVAKSATVDKGGESPAVKSTQVSNDGRTQGQSLPGGAPGEDGEITGPPGESISDAGTSAEGGQENIRALLADIAAGRPVRVYHGSPKQGLVEANIATSFTTHRPLAQKYGPYVYEAQLSIPENNPLRWKAQDLLKELQEGSITEEEAASQINKPNEIRNAATAPLKLSEEGIPLSGNPALSSKLAKSKSFGPENPITRDDEGWHVLMDDGKRVSVGTVDAALHLQQNLMRAKDEKEAAAMIGIADEIQSLFSSAGQRSAQTFTGDRVIAEGGEVTKTSPAGKVSKVEFNTESSVAELNRELAILGGDGAALVQGSNWVAEDGRQMMQTHQTTQGAMTQIHEMADRRIGSLYTPEVFATKATAAARALTSTGIFDPAKQRTAEDKVFAERVQKVAAGQASLTEARETISELITANWAGRRKDGSNFAAGHVSAAVSGALKASVNPAERKALGWFRSLLLASRAWLRGVMSVAAKLAKAKRDGKLKDGNDFDSLVREIFGVSEQKQFVDGVKKEVEKEMPDVWDESTFKPTVDNGEAFSLASSNALEALANRFENTALPPEKRLKIYEGVADTLRGINRAMQFNDADAGPSGLAGIEKQRSAMRRKREEELLQEVEKDFLDIEGSEFIATATNLPVIDAIMRKTPGDTFPRGRIRSRTKAGGGGAEYDGGREMPSWLFGGNIAPDQMAQELYEAGLLREETTDAMWTEIGKALQSAGAAKERLKKYAERKAEARAQAREEAQAWADQQTEGLDSTKRDAERKDLKRLLMTMEAMLVKLPSEIRGKIGGWTKIADLKTDKAKLKFLESRAAKIDTVLEKFLQEEYTAAIEKIFERAGKKQNVAGEKAASSVGADAAALLKSMEAAMTLDEAGVSGAVSTLEARVASGELSPEQEALTLREIELVKLAGDWKNADAATMAEAHRAAEETFNDGWLEWAGKIIAKRERRQGMRDALGADTGKAGGPDERNARLTADQDWFGRRKDDLLGLSDYRQVLEYAFGPKSDTARKLEDSEREASYQYSDLNWTVEDKLGDFLEKLAGGRLKAEKLRYDLATVKIPVSKLGTATEMEMVDILLTWAQDDGKRHMEAFGYDGDFAAEIEGKLSDKGREVLKFLSGDYSVEHGWLNPYYRERHGVNLPSHDNYAPLSVKPGQAGDGKMYDPVTGMEITGNTLTPSSLRTRSRSATAEPDFKDAMQKWLAHKRQLNFWVAYYDYAQDYRAVMGNRDLANKIEAAGGKEALNSLRKFGDFFLAGGFRDASSQLAMSNTARRITGRAATIHLAGNIGTRLIQSVQLAAIGVEMPASAYVYYTGKAMFGGFVSSLKTDFIQRRLRDASPVVRQILDGYRSSRPNAARHLAAEMAKTLSGADALFAAVTHNAILEYQRAKLKKEGFSSEDVESMAQAEAIRGTERIAQPVRPAQRSLIELTTPSAMKGMFMAYVSDPRQKAALSAWAVANSNKPVSHRAKVIFFAWIFPGILAQVMRNTWRDRQDDDDDELFDEKNWNWKRLALATMAGPINGIPFGVGQMVEDVAGYALGATTPDGSLLDAAPKAMKAGGNLMTGESFKADEPTEAVIRDINSIIAGLGMFNDTAAASAAVAKFVKDTASVADSLSDDETERGLKQMRKENRADRDKSEAKKDAMTPEQEEAKRRKREREIKAAAGRADR